MTAARNPAEAPSGGKPHRAIRACLAHGSCASSTRIIIAPPIRRVSREVSALMNRKLPRRAMGTEPAANQAATLEVDFLAVEPDAGDGAAELGDGDYRDGDGGAEYPYQHGQGHHAAAESGDAGDGKSDGGGDQDGGDLPDGDFGQGGFPLRDGWGLRLSYTINLTLPIGAADWAGMVADGADRGRMRDIRFGSGGNYGESCRGRSGSGLWCRRLIRWWSRIFTG